MNFVEMGKSLLKNLVLGIDLENIADPSLQLFQISFRRKIRMDMRQMF